METQPRRVAISRTSRVATNERASEKANNAKKSRVNSNFPSGCNTRHHTPMSLERTFHPFRLFANSWRYYDDAKVLNVVSKTIQLAVGVEQPFAGSAKLLLIVS